MTDNQWASMPPLQAQAEIITEMSRSLLSDVAGDWDHAVYTSAELGGQGSSSLEVVGMDGNSTCVRFRMSSALPEALRRVMFVEGRGSWFSMRLTVRSGGSVEASFDYESRPEFDSKMLGVTPYWVGREQRDFPRDKAHQPPWYAELLDQYITAEQARLDLWAARDRLWGQVGQASEVSDSVRLVVLPGGVGVLATDGYSNPSANHPGDPGFELFMPSGLFAEGPGQARQAWPGKALGYLVMTTTQQDIDWPALTAGGPVAVNYFPNVANDTPADWRDQAGEPDVCGMLVGVPCPGVPGVLDGPAGPIRLIGVVPARPAEWVFLSEGGEVARQTILARLGALDTSALAAPDRPSVV